jgi:RimJ/RimL family protein N-acetyltransferase
MMSCAPCGAIGRSRRRWTIDIRLEPLAATHLDGIAAMIDDPHSLRFTRIPEPTPPDFPSTLLTRYEAGLADGTRAAFAIVDVADDAFLGVVLAPEIDRASSTAELGYIVTPALRGRGVATAALRRMTAWVFSELGIERLELQISVDNPASKEVARRSGYTYEGTMRSAFVKPGRREDTEMWSRLRSDDGTPG